MTKFPKEIMHDLCIKAANKQQEELFLMTQFLEDSENKITLAAFCACSAIGSLAGVLQQAYPDLNSHTACIMAADRVAKLVREGASKAIANDQAG